MSLYMCFDFDEWDLRIIKKRAINSFSLNFDQDFLLSQTLLSCLCFYILSKEIFSFVIVINNIYITVFILLN
jgi:hypothetical protein